jgi:hypothetical protein
MYVTMLPRVLMIHIIYVLNTIHMAHIVHMGTYWTYGACGTYGTHVPYLQMVHISMDLPNEYKHVFTNGSKNKISSTPNV